MATSRLPAGFNWRATVTGTGSALVVVTVIGALFLVRPNLGFAAVFAGMLVGFVGLFLTVQHRSTTGHRGVIQTADGEGNHYTGEYGGVLGAWATGGSTDELERRVHYVAIAFSFFSGLTVGCFLLIFFAHPVANALSSLVG